MKSDKLMALFKKTRTLKSKRHLHLFISTIRMKQRNAQNGSKYTHHKSQTMTF